MTHNKEDFGYLGTSTMPECEDYRDLLKKQGIPFEERVIPGMGTFYSPAEEIHYRNKDGLDRWVYVVISGGADYWGETCYAFAQPVPDDLIAAIIEGIRKDEQE